MAPKFLALEEEVYEGDKLICGSFIFIIYRLKTVPPDGFLLFLCD